MMLPDGLIWIMEKLGFDWPDVDEDELRRGAQIISTFRDDLESSLQAVDRTVNGDMAAAMRGQAGPAFVSAWNTNRSQNLQKLVDLLVPVPPGIDIAADIVLGLKIKVIFEVTTTAAALVAMLTNPVTALGAAGMVVLKKKLLNAAVDTAVEQALGQVLPVVIEPLAEELPAVIMAVLDAPVVEAAVGDADEFYADLEALEQAEMDLDMYAGDIEGLMDRLAADLAGLNITGD
jgi:hypothetical protein